MNTPRRGASFTDSNVIFTNVVESAAALPKRWFRMRLTKLLSPGFPVVTARKLTRLRNVPVSAQIPRPCLLCVVLSTPEECKALLRFAFRLKGSVASVQLICYLLIG